MAKSGRILYRKIWFPTNLRTLHTNMIANFKIYVIVFMPFHLIPMLRVIKGKPLFWFWFLHSLLYFTAIFILWPFMGNMGNVEGVLREKKIRQFVLVAILDFSWLLYPTRYALLFDTWGKERTNSSLCGGGHTGLMLFIWVPTKGPQL